MTLNEIMAELQALGSETTRKIWMKHGARDPFFGVKVEDLKKILKRTGRNNQLAIELYRTGNSDAMYLAGLMSEPARMTPEILREWAEKAYWYMLSEYTVAWVTAESPYALELATEWMQSPLENLASSGWAVCSNYLMLVPDEKINPEWVQSLLEKVENQITGSPNRVKYTMNGFVIAAGAYYVPLRPLALEVARRIGKVKVDMHGTACQVPVASDYLNKMFESGRPLKKKKTVIC